MLGQAAKRGLAPAQHAGLSRLWQYLPFKYATVQVTVVIVMGKNYGGTNEHGEGVPDSCLL